MDDLYKADRLIAFPNKSLDDCNVFEFCSQVSVSHILQETTKV